MAEVPTPISLSSVNVPPCARTIPISELADVDAGELTRSHLRA